MALDDNTMKTEGVGQLFKTLGVKQVEKSATI